MLLQLLSFVVSAGGPSLAQIQIKNFSSTNQEAENLIYKLTGKPPNLVPYLKDIAGQLVKLDDRVRQIQRTVTLQSFDNAAADIIQWGNQYRDHADKTYGNIDKANICKKILV